MVKQKNYKILAGFLALLMIVSVLPVSVLTMAAPPDNKTKHIVTITDGNQKVDLSGVEITMTNKNNQTEVLTAATTNGVATFEISVTRSATYTISVADIYGYESVEDVDVEINGGPGRQNTTSITLIAREKVTVSGVVSDENDVAYEGATVALYFSGEEKASVTTDAEGKYSLEACKGQEITVSVSPKEEDEKYTVEPVTASYNEDATVDFGFSVKTFTIDTTADENGTVTVTEPETDIIYGENREIEIAANDGYRIEKILGNNEDLTGDAAGEKSYTLSLENITKNYEITVSFYRMTYKVTFTVGENGEVTYGEDETGVVDGGNIEVAESTDPENPTAVTITAKPNDGYRVSYVNVDDDVKVDSSEEKTENGYTYSEMLEMTKDHTFEVEFAPNEHTLTVENGENGSASWSKEETETTITVNYGDSATLYVTANVGYRINEICVGDEVVTDADGKAEYAYELKAVDANETITVSFRRMTYKVTFTVGENGEVTYGEDETGTAVDSGSVEFEESTDPKNPTAVTITATPNEGYRVSYVKVDSNGKKYTENDYKHVETLEMTKDHTFEVEFAINEYTLTAESDENGSASWIRNQNKTETTVKYGDSATLYIKPANGYAIKTVTVNGTEATSKVEEDGFGIYIEFESIVKNIEVVVTYVRPDEITIDDEILDNNYYKITLSDEPVKAVYKDGETRVVVLPKDAKATLTAVEPYYEIKYNSDTAQNGYEKSITISKTTLIKNIWVKKGIFADQKKDVAVNVKIVIDKTAPNIDSLTASDWTNSDTVTINGSASDAGDSGLHYIVWSRDKELSEDEVLDAEDAISISGTEFSIDFSIVCSGEQDSTYYVYAVDYAGNVSAAKTVQVKIDQTKPVVTEFKFSTDENNLVENLINFLSWGTLCKEKMYVTVMAADMGNFNSGIREISLYYGSSKTLLGTVQTNSAATFELTAEIFKNGAEIYAVATDIAGNISEETKPTEVKTNASNNTVQIATDKPTATITPATEVYKDENGNLWYNGNTEFTVDVADDISGIGSVVIKMNGKELEADLNSVDLTQYFSEVEKVNKKSFVIGTSQNVNDGFNTIEVVVTNAAGVTSEIYTQNVYIDTTAPDVIGYEITTINDSPLDKVFNFLTFGIFFNEQVKITVTAEDTNSSSGIATVTLYVDGEAFATQKVNESNKTTFTVTVDELDVDSVYAGNISAVATDNVGNVTATAVGPNEVNEDIKSGYLMLETVAPTIKVDIADEIYADKNGNLWYNGDAEFTVTAKDEDSGIRNVVITINDKELVNDSFYNNEDADTETHEEVYKVSTADATISEDGSYTIKVSVIDNAGNINNTYSRTVYKDIYNPYITGFDFEATDYVEGSETDASVEVTDYGFYFKADTNVTISAGDVAPSAGIKSITYYTVDYTNDTDGVKSAEKTVLVNADNEITITIPANFKGQIYAKATDNATNTTEVFVNPNSAIVESPDKHEEETHIRFEKSNTKYTANDGSELYSDNVDVVITVTDTYSGIREIEWSVVAPYDTSNNQSGKVTLNNDKTYADGSDGWQQTKTESNLVTEMKKTITVANNSNNIVVKVKMTDRVGNVSEEEIEFSIDKTAPTIVVSYDNNDADSNTFFKADRTATVVITERNFNAEDVVVTITNTDGTVPTISEFTKKNGTGNGDDTTWTATIKYTADGDYTFDIAYTDLADNKYSGETFSEGTVASNEFTIDKTVPVISVSYDNNDAQNGNYYKAVRTATVVIAEHNFNPDRVTITHMATDDGVDTTKPTVSGWTTTGDKHTATIYYGKDAKYTFDIAMNDKAGNASADYTEETFFVDMTMPTLEISGVANNSANKGDVIPVVSYSDTNYDADKVTITLTGANRKAVELDGSYADIHNGRTFTFKNFAEEKAIDDIYTLTATLTDKAGNTTTQTVTFSVNRFGSTYALSDAAEQLNGTYVKEPVDVVLTETNADELSNIKITLFKDGEATVLKEETDYKIEVTGGSGQWFHYTYTIFAENFAADGVYSLTIESDDKAGNAAKNDQDTKNTAINFGVDSTLPIINIENLESKTTYALDNMTVKMSVKDNLKLTKVIVELDGKEYKSWSGEELEAIIQNGGNFTFDISGDSTDAHNLVVYAIDAAGNGEKISDTELPANAEKVEDFYVTTNLWVRYYTNKPLFFGSIAGVIVLAGLIVTLVVYKKKKNEK